MELVQMSKRELERHGVMQLIELGAVNQRVAGERLGVGVRQIKRLWSAYKAKGATGLISKQRGRRSNRAIAKSKRNAIMSLVRTQYADFGPTLACEYLQDTHGYSVGVETLRRWMIQEQLWKPKVKRARRHHSRERRARMGELVQIDGSPHDWFEGRSGKCSLLAFIDDATSKVLVARFYESETTKGYLQLVQRHVTQFGRALAYYSDRHAIFTKHDPEDPDPTQFARALLQLDIEPIQARSPQAKGRVERLFQTLQDRMVKAMRLAGINDIQSANAWIDGYIEQHNAQFAQPTAKIEDAHRPFAGSAIELARICAVHHTRKLNTALNCQFQGDILQVHEHQANAPKGAAYAQIIEHTNGEIELLHQGKPLIFSAYGRYAHLKQQSEADDKTINARVDAVCARVKPLSKQRSQAQLLKAQMAHQEAQRAKGIYTPTHYTSMLPKTSVQAKKRINKAQTSLSA